MDRFTPTALLLIAILTGGVWLYSAHTAVAERVKVIDELQRVDHDRLSRIEAQLEYVGKITLQGLNEQRAEKGKPLVPDEFPRE